MGAQCSDNRGRFCFIRWADTPKYVFYTYSLILLLFKKKEKLPNAEKGGRWSQPPEIHLQIDYSDLSCWRILADGKRETITDETPV